MNNITIDNNEAKASFQVYVGRYSQRGHGSGNIIGSLFRRILPALKATAPHLLRTGASVIEDVKAGKPWKESAIKRVLEGFHGIAFEEQSGSGKRKRPVRDIFA
jgi:hypothetical protein